MKMGVNIVRETSNFFAKVEVLELNETLLWNGLKKNVKYIFTIRSESSRYCKSVNI